MDYRRPKWERQTRRYARSSAFDRLDCTTQLLVLANGEGSTQKKAAPGEGAALAGLRLILERVQLGDALLLFLLAGGFVAEVSLLLLGVGGVGSRVRAGLDIVDLIGSLGGLFRGGQCGVNGAYCLDDGVGVGRGRADHLNAHAGAALGLLKLQGRLGALVAAGRFIDAGGRRS